MRCSIGAAAVLILWAGLAHADDPADKTPERKKAAEAAWETVGAGEFSTLETKHLLIYAPKDWEKRLKGLGTLLEKQYDQAKGALGYDDKTDPLPAKAVVYLFDERDHFAAFVRRVEKRRLDSDETACFSADDDALHAAVGPTPAKDDWADGRPRRGTVGGSDAGPKGRDKSVSAGVADGRLRPGDVLPCGRRPEDDGRPPGGGGVGGEGRRQGRLDRARPIRRALQGSLADYFAYGPASGKFLALVKGFEPEENVEKQTTEHALDAAGLTPERVEKSWKAWATAAK